MSLSNDRRIFVVTWLTTLLSIAPQLRLDVDEADWLPLDIRNRLREQESGRMNKSGELIVTSDVKRTQRQNIDMCFSKLKELVSNAAVEPKEREQWEGIGEVTKRKRKDAKRRRSEIKSARNYRRDDDY